MKSFTFIETILTIFIFTLAMGAVSGFILMAYRTQGYAWQQSLAISEAKRGIETMVKEIREARAGDDGSYPIELAGDKEFIFYSDIDEDGLAEKVRYFLGAINSETQTQECQTSLKGGSCSVLFSDFLEGTLVLAEVKISVEGDFGSYNEYAEIYADGNYLGRICSTGCLDCPEDWQGIIIFAVNNFALDNSVLIEARASSKVDSLCPYSMKMKAEFSYTEDLTGLVHEFKKGVTKPTGIPLEYLPENEVITILTSYVRNAPPIFEYFDQTGNKILDYPAKLKDTKIMKVYLTVNVNPNRSPDEFELESYVQLRNLKQE